MPLVKNDATFFNQKKEKRKKKKEREIGNRYFFFGYRTMELEVLGERE